MDKNVQQSRYLLLVIYAVGVFVVAFSFYNFFIINDYGVMKQIPCDPKADSCFVSDCESNDSTCDQTSTYMKIIVPSNRAGSDYESLSCAKNDPLCQVITCNNDTVEAGEKCYQ